MKKIVTAIGNPKLNELLKKEKQIDIICKDIQYEEAVIEILKINKVDFLILHDKILKEKNICNEIKNIQKIQKEVKIILILEEKNLYINKIKKILNIYCIFYNKKTNINIIFKKINFIIKNNYKKNNIKNNYKNKNILIDCTSEKKVKINNNLISKNNKIFIITEAKILEIKIVKKYIDKLVNIYGISKNNIFIIICNYNKNSIDMLIIKKCFRGIKVIGKINENNRRSLWKLQKRLI